MAVIIGRMQQPPPLVLIAHPDAAVRQALAFALDLEGFNVRAHPQAAALLDDPDLPRAGCIVTDDGIVPAGGRGLLDHLQRRTPRIPVILLADFVTPVLLARAKAAGCRLVIEKPAFDNVLVDAIRGLLAPGRDAPQA